MNSNVQRRRLIAAACAALTLAVWFVPASNLHGQEPSSRHDLTTVVRNATAGTAYAQQDTQFLPPFVAWSQAGLPPAVLAETLTEGIARRVSAERIVAALEARAARAQVLGTLLPAPPAFPATEDFASWLRLTETALRAGIPAGSLTALLSQGITRRTARAVVVAVDLHQSAGLSGSQAGELSIALVTSRISETNFENVLPLVVRNRTRLGGEELVTIISAVLNSGGGFVQIEAELSARRR